LPPLFRAFAHMLIPLSTRMGEERIGSAENRTPHFYSERGLQWQIKRSTQSIRSRWYTSSDARTTPYSHERASHRTHLYALTQRRANAVTIMNKVRGG